MYCEAPSLTKALYKYEYVPHVGSKGHILDDCTGDTPIRPHRSSFGLLLACTDALVDGLYGTRRSDRRAMALSEGSAYGLKALLASHLSVRWLCCCHHVGPSEQRYTLLEIASCIIQQCRASRSAQPPCSLHVSAADLWAAAAPRVGCSCARFGSPWQRGDRCSACSVRQ